MFLVTRCLPLALLLLVGSTWAQEYRATLLGVVTDPTGAAVPAAQVTVTNTETGVRAATKSNTDGNYVIPFIVPGTYRLRVEHEGFKTYERSPIALRVNDRVRIEVALEMGQVSDQVTVTAQAPLLETSSSSRGQVIDNLQISELPLNGRNPFSLMSIAVGVQQSRGATIYSRPYDNGALADFSINGGRVGINEYQIDGAPDNANTGRANIAYSPPAEATQEFKVQTNTYDAQYGRTAGGIISVSIKPGTNSLHGAAYEYMRRTGWQANQFSNNALGVARPMRLNDQYGFELDGPVTIPRLYSGKNRTFFMVALERERDKLPRSFLGSVPTQEQRNGDFSQTLNPSGNVYTIYDPLTVTANPKFDPAKPVTLSNLMYLRTPFPNNRVPQDRMSPLAVRVLKDIPLGNQAGNAITQLNNWYYGSGTTDSAYQSFIARVDHTLSDAWKIFGRWHHSFRDGAGSKDFYNWNTPATFAAKGGRTNDGAVVDVVGTFSPRTILNARVGFTRFVEDQTRVDALPVVDLVEMGFPRSFVSQLDYPTVYPVFKWQDYLGTSVGLSSRLPSDTYAAQGTLMRIQGGHSMKFGAEFRLLHFSNIERTTANGDFAFTRRWTTSNPNVTDAAAGNAIADFLLGYMNSASVKLNSVPYLSWRYPVVYFQDDWQVNRRLTLNIGLRWDYESPPVERFDRQNRGFGFTAASPYKVAGYDLRGGLLFAGRDGQPRGAFVPDRNNWQPRFGLAYKVLQSKSLVFRAGVGRYFLPTVEFGGTTGFSQVTSAVVSTAEYLPYDVLSNPFRNGLTPRPGATNGLGTDVGNSVSFSDPERAIPNVWQFSAGFQYEMIPGLLLDVSYVGSRTSQLQVSKSLNFLTKEQLALGQPYLTTTVANPFYGVLPVNTTKGAQATVQRGSLLTQYPQFGSVTQSNTSLGSSWYNALQLKLEQRFKHGLSLLASYTNSKTMEAAAYLNAQDTELARELVTFDTPQRLVVTAVYEFPIGPTKKWAGNGILSHIVGGWEINWSAVFASGMPMPYPNYLINGNPKLENGQTLDRWFDTSASIWVQPAAGSLRVTPLRSPNIRRHNAPQIDVGMLRVFRIKEGHKLQFRVSAYNATNTPIFDFPNTTPTSALFGVSAPKT